MRLSIERGSYSSSTSLPRESLAPLRQIRALHLANLVSSRSTFGPFNAKKMIMQASVCCPGEARVRRPRLVCGADTARPVSLPSPFWRWPRSLAAGGHTREQILLRSRLPLLRLRMRALWVPRPARNSGLGRTQPGLRDSDHGLMVALNERWGVTWTPVAATGNAVRCTPPSAQ